MRDRFAHLPGEAIVLFADNSWIEQYRRGAQGIDGGVHALSAMDLDSTIMLFEVAGNSGHGRIREIVGRHVDGFDRGHRYARDRGDALMQRGDFGGERWLIADTAGQAPEQSRDLAARLNETKYVVHQQEDVLALLIAGSIPQWSARSVRRASAHPGVRSFARRLERCDQERRTAAFRREARGLRGALADAGKDGNALVAFHHRMDALHDHDGLADAGAAEHGRFASLRKRSEKSMTLMPVSKHGGRGTALSERRRNSVDVVRAACRPALNSNDWYNNFQGIPKSLVHQNRFGGALGGPLTPHIAGGKTYFYVNYEGYRYPRSSPTEEGVPSAMMRNGVLQFADGSGNLIQYDLKTSTQCGATGGLACDPRGIGLNPVVSQIWSKYVPLPNDFHTGDLTNGNYYGFIGNLSYPQSDDFMVGRIDHDFGLKWRAFASYRWFNDSNANASQVDYGGVLPGDTVGHPALGSSTAVKPRYFVIGVTGNLAPSVTNEFHFSYTRNYWHWNRAGAVPLYLRDSRWPGIRRAKRNSATLFAPINMDTQDARERLWGEHNNDFRGTVS